MLRRPASLRTRAILIFIPIYLATFLAALIFLHSASRSFEEDHHFAPAVAIAFAIDDLRSGPDGLSIAADGAFAEFARDKPDLWLIAEDRAGHRLSVGQPPASLAAPFLQLRQSVDSAQFHVPGQSRPESDAAFRAIATAGGTVYLAAGGVDASSISFAHSMRYFANVGLFPAMLFLALLGVLVMSIALPLLTRAITALTRRLAGKAALEPIPIDEAPHELRPLVRALNDALASAERELTRHRELIAAVAHELRTPLSVLSLRADQVASPALRTELQRGFARLNGLVGSMLDVERFRHDACQRDRIDARALARDVVQELAPLAMASGYEIALDAPGSFAVSGDAAALFRALSNLVSNAIAHAGGSGTISVVVGGNHIDVLDEGPGVPADLRERLFEPFEKGGDPDGCGLGLYLVREIMTAHGGTIDLIEGGHGFRMSFPAGAE